MVMRCKLTFNFVCRAEEDGPWKKNEGCHVALPERTPSGFCSLGHRNGWTRDGTQRLGLLYRVA